MSRIKEKIRNIRDTKDCSAIMFWGRLLLINIIAYLTIMLLFEPTTKSDDYDMCNVLYGGVNGEYSSFVLYVNVVLGHFLKFLTAIFPSVSWYFVVQTISIFLGFCAITYVLMKKNPLDRFLVYYVILMLFAAYEIYVRITFSKTGALLMIAGFILILYAIDERAGLSKYLVGFAFILLGILWRSGMLILIVGVFFSVYIMFFVQSWGKWNKEFWRKTVCFSIATIVSLLLVTTINKIQSYTFNTDEVWSEYIRFNTIRSSLLDYGWPDYESFYEEYQEIGISENDYIMWSKYANIADTDRFTEETISEIRSIYKVSEDEPLYQILIDATREIFDYFLKNEMFFLVLICIILLLICGDKKNYLIVVYVGACWLLAYYYMYYRGRLQNHIDASIAIAGAVILLYYCSGKASLSKKQMVNIAFPVSIVLSLAVNSFYQDITTSNYLGAYYGVIESQKEFAHDNYKKMSLLSEDREHLYLISAYETHTIYPCFAPDEIIEKGFYHNIFRLNQYTIPVFRQPLIDYGVNNPFSDIVNNKTVYYCASEERNFEVGSVLQYISENYSPNAYVTLVKYIENLFIYRVDEGKLKVNLDNVKEDNSKVTQSISYSFEEEGKVIVSGYAYIDGEDSFAQNIYIEIRNKESGENTIYYTLQTENEKLRSADKYSGKYSSFEAGMDLGDIDLNDVEINVLLENGQEIYRLPLNNFKK